MPVIGPKDKDTAKGLLDAATALGHPASAVRSVLLGFDVPQDVADRFHGDSEPPPEPAPKPRKRTPRKKPSTTTP